MSTKMPAKVAGAAEIPPQMRVRYWLAFARCKHRREMQLLLYEAKLGGKPRKVREHWEGWNNVIKHQVGEAIAIRILGEMLRLPPEQLERQETFAFIHDAEKHLSIYRERKASGMDMSHLPPSETFSPDEQAAMEKRYEQIRDELDPTRNLSVATSEDFFYTLFERTRGVDITDKLRNTPFDALLQYYVDSIFDDGSILDALELIEKRERRRGDLNDDPERTRRLGMKYWDAERLVAPKVQAAIWQRLKETGVDSPSPEALPGLIRQKIAQEIVVHWLQVHGQREVVVIDLEVNQSRIQIETLSCTKRSHWSGIPAPENNEDSGIIQQRGTLVKIGIFDGATSIGANLTYSPGKAAAVTCREAVASAPFNESPRDMLLRANALLRGIPAALASDADRSPALSAVGATGRLDLEAMILEFGCVADSHILILHEDGTSAWLSKNTSEHSERLEIAAAVWGAEHPGHALPEDEALLKNLNRVMALDPQQRPTIDPLEDARVIEVIARNRRLENDLDAGGQPSLKGSDDTLLRRGIQEGSTSVRRGDQILFLTDGAYPGPLYTPAQQQEVIDVLRRGGIQELRRWVYDKEEADPCLRDPPRMKQYDDLVVLCLRVM